MFFSQCLTQKISEKMCNGTFLKYIFWLYLTEDETVAGQETRLRHEGMT